MSRTSRSTDRTFSFNSDITYRPPSWMRHSGGNSRRNSNSSRSFSRGSRSPMEGVIYTGIAVDDGRSSSNSINLFRANNDIRIYLGELSNVVGRYYNENHPTWIKREVANLKRDFPFIATGDVTTNLRTAERAITRITDVLNEINSGLPQYLDLVTVSNTQRIVKRKRSKSQSKRSISSVKKPKRSTTSKKKKSSSKKKSTSFSSSAKKKKPIRWTKYDDQRAVMKPKGKK